MAARHRVPALLGQVRKADEVLRRVRKGNDGMRTAIAFLAALPLFALDGTVVNQTSGKPQAGVIISLVQPSQAGSPVTIPDVKLFPANTVPRHSQGVDRCRTALQARRGTPERGF